jgi:hypothetical protein
MATPLSSPIPNTSRRLTFQRLSLAAVSGQQSYGVCVLSCSAFRGSDRFTATVSIRQRQAARDGPSLHETRRHNYLCPSGQRSRCASTYRFEIILCALEPAFRTTWHGSPFLNNFRFAAAH